MSQFPIILASGSPQRKALLAEAGYEFDVLPPDDSVESGICSNCGPVELVLDLSARKAAYVASQLHSDLSEPTLIVACDTVAECGGMILGKPRNEDHARTMLEQLRGTRHRVYSGLCLWLIQPSKRTAPQTRVAITELEMELLSDEAIDEYLSSGMWRGKAGAFGIQDRPSWLKIVEGSESNVIGLPLELLAKMIDKLGEPKA